MAGVARTIMSVEQLRCLLTQLRLSCSGNPGGTSTGLVLKMLRATLCGRQSNTLATHILTGTEPTAPIIFWYTRMTEVCS